MILPECLEGYGITLRRWRPGDEELLHRVVVESIGHLQPWMPWISEEPQTVEQRRGLLVRWEQEWLSGGDAAYAVLVADGAVAGGCGLHHRRGPGTLEIGYWTHPAFLSRGIATAAARLLTDAAFAIPGIEQVEIHHDKANTASRGVPQRLGYEFVEERPDRHDAPAEIGVDCTWRIARNDWLQLTSTTNTPADESLEGSS